MSKLKRVAWVVPVAVLAVGAGAAAKDVLDVGIAEWYETASINYWTTDVIPAFKKLHPDMDVNVHKISWGADKLTAQYIAGSAPDVVQFGGDKFGSFLPMLEPLSDYMKSKPIDNIADLAPGALQAVAKAGVQYGIPYNLDARTLIYRKSLFEGAGLDPNKGPDTWDDLVNYAQKLVKRDAGGKITTEGLHFEAYWFNFGSWMFAAGGRYVSNDLTHSTFNSPEVKDAIQFGRDLNHVYNVTVKDGQDFDTGKVAMTIESAGAVADPAKAADIGVPLPPKRGDHPRTAMTAADSWGMINTSKHKQAAWDWIRLCMEAQYEAGIARTAGILPTRLSLANQAPWNTEGLHGFFQAASMSQGFNGAAPGFENIVHDVVTPTLESIVYGDGVITDLDAASAKIDGLLKDAAEKMHIKK